MILLKIWHHLSVKYIRFGIFSQKDLETQCTAGINCCLKQF